jgi:hypothetical protein
MDLHGQALSSMNTMLLRERYTRCQRSEVPETDYGSRCTVHDCKANDVRCTNERTVLRLGVVDYLIPVTRGQRRVTSGELAVRIQKLGIHGLDGSAASRKLQTPSTKSQTTHNETGLRAGATGIPDSRLPRAEQRDGGAGCRQSICSVHGRPEPQFSRGLGGPGTAPRLASADPPRGTPDPSTTVT